MQYVGKGSYNRALTSARRLSRNMNDPDVNVDWEWAEDTKAAFKAEYLKMKNLNYGKPTARLYNRIQSPGEKYLYEDAMNEDEE